MSKTAVFGYELLLDLYECKPGVCDDLTLCYNFLDEIDSASSKIKVQGARYPEKLEKMTGL